MNAPARPWRPRDGVWHSNDRVRQIIVSDLAIMGSMPTMRGTRITALSILADSRAATALRACSRIIPISIPLAWCPDAGASGTGDHARRGRRGPAAPGAVDRKTSSGAGETGLL
jgi:hypothetical protein